jgi:hypothetical protein
MSKQPYHNDASAEDRIAVHRNDRRVHKNTYFSHTHPDEGGRFAVSDQPPRHVVGSTPVPRYPALPESSWANQGAAVPAEEPLGYRTGFQGQYGSANPGNPTPRGELFPGWPSKK